MGFLGMKLGKNLGKMLGGAIGGKTGRKIGGTLGEIGGAELVPYKKGGKVKKTGPALLHKNEFVLPSTVKPTKAQKKAVAALKKKK